MTAGDTYHIKGGLLGRPGVAVGGADDFTFSVNNNTGYAIVVKAA